jgi:hypothetical protein
MKIESQVTNLELSKRLKSLGVPQESLFYWAQVAKDDWRIGQHSRYGFTVSQTEGSVIGTEVCAAFTCSELGEMLPKNENLVLMLFPNGRCQMIIQSSDDFRISLGSKGYVEADTEADARGLMLCYLLENKLITL